MLIINAFSQCITFMKAIYTINYAYLREAKNAVQAKQTININTVLTVNKCLKSKRIKVDGDKSDETKLL